MKHFILTTIILAVLLIPVTALADETTVTIDLSKLDPAQATAVLEAKKKIEALSQPVVEVVNTEKLNEWADVGLKVGQALSSICKELSIGVNDFIQTPVGKLTMVLIVWKVVGIELWNIVGGITVWVAMMSLVWYSFRFFHMTKKITTYDHGNPKMVARVDYVRRYIFESKDAKVGSTCAHVIIMVIVTIVCLSIIF